MFVFYTITILFVVEFRMLCTASTFNTKYLNLTYQFLYPSVWFLLHFHPKQCGNALNKVRSGNMKCSQDVVIIHRAMLCKTFIPFPSCVYTMDTPFQLDRAALSIRVTTLHTCFIHESLQYCQCFLSICRS